ncbi:MAG: hypothetical protein JW925_10835 [Syntrophaceae bacterium]|nr:hypothetical protein [Syntrophaceae bacterium]
MDLICDSKYFQLFAQKEAAYISDGITLIIDGFVLPRREIHGNYDNLSQYDLILRLFKEHHGKFLDYIKGSFIIIILYGDEVVVCNDIHSIKKYYYFKKGREYSVSNNLKLISQQNGLEINELFPSIQALFQHPVAGITMFNDVFYSEPASKLTLNENISVESYWTPKSYLAADRSRYSLEQVIETFVVVIKNYITYFSPHSISITLTGGRDTRSILAALLNLGINPHAFTFGFPSGNDVLTAKLITDKLKIPFTNHFIEKLSPEIYQTLAKEIIKNGNPNVHLHRAHRLDAIKKEADVLGKIDMLFMGVMGGDYIKGVSFNDYIVTEFMRRYFFENIDINTLIKQILDKNFIVYSEPLLSKLVSVIEKLEFMDKGNFKQSEYLIAHSFIGSLHDVQDINLFSEYADYVVAPFMDIDVFETLFQSPFSLFSHERSSKNPFKKIQGGILQANIIHRLYPPLADIPLANKYKPKDILGNGYLYFLKRIYLQLFKVNKKPSFSYGNWFKDYIHQNIMKFETDLIDRYKMDQLKESLLNSDHKTIEGYWHKYSNPLMIAQYTKQIKGI